MDGLVMAIAHFIRRAFSASRQRESQPAADGGGPDCRNHVEPKSLTSYKGLPYPAPGPGAMRHLRAGDLQPKTGNSMDNITIAGHAIAPPGANRVAAPPQAPVQAPATIPAPILRAGDAQDWPPHALAALAGDRPQHPAPVVMSQPRYIGAPFDSTPLGCAAYTGDLEQVVFLIGQGVDVNALEKRDPYGYGYTALLAAIEMGHADIVRVLVEAGADVNLHNHGRLGFPLELAAERGYQDIVQFLLGQPGILANPGGSAFTPFRYAVRRGHLGIAEMLIERFPVSQEELKSLIFRSCEYGNIAMVNFLRRRGGFSAADLNDSCCLHAAAMNGQTELIAYLFDYGVAADAVDWNGCTALEYACTNGHLPVVDMLLRRLRIDLRVSRPESLPALLLIAVHCRNLDLLAYLLAAGADPNQQDRRTGWTALMAAAAAGAIDIVQMLLACPGLKLDLPCHSGSTALEQAKLHRRVDVAACLLEAGASVRIPDDYNGSLLKWAVNLRDANLVRLVLDQCRSASMRAHAHCGAAMAHAARTKCVGILELLLDWGHTVIGFDDLMAICWVPSVSTSHAVAIRRVLAAEANYARARAAGQSYQGKLAYDVAIYKLENYLPCIAINDLLRSYGKTAGFRLAITGSGTQPVPGQPLTLLNQLIAAGTSPGSMGIDSREGLLRSLSLQSMLMTVALPVADCLTGRGRALALMAGPGCAVNAQQTAIYYAAALNTLAPAALKEEAARIYALAGISAHGRERVELAMQRDLDALMSMIGQIGVLLGQEMLEKIMPACKGHTAGDYQVDVAGLAAVLVGHGLIGPLASAVAESWKKAVGMMMGMPLQIPSGGTFAQVANLMGEALGRHGQLHFASILPGILNKSDLLAALGKMTGAAEEDKALHLLFQIQCDQLRQYCRQIGKH
jgi:ankyrin repeat protein